MEQVSTRSDAIPAPTYTPSVLSTRRSYWTRPAILYAIGDEPGYAGSEPPHLAPLRQRTLNRMCRVLDMLGLDHAPPALPRGLEG